MNVTVYYFYVGHTNLVIVTVSEELFPRGILKKTPLWRKCKLRQEVCTLGLLCSRLQEIQKGHITATTSRSQFLRTLCIQLQRLGTNFWTRKKGVVFSGTVFLDGCFAAEVCD